MVTFPAHGLFQKRLYQDFYQDQRSHFTADMPAARLMNRSWSRPCFISPLVPPSTGKGGQGLTHFSVAVESVKEALHAPTPVSKPPFRVCHNILTTSTAKNTAHFSTEKKKKQPTNITRIFQVNLSIVFIHSTFVPYLLSTLPQILPPHPHPPNHSHLTPDPNPASWEPLL